MVSQAFAGEHSVYGVEHYPQVNAERNIFNIQHIVGKTLHHLVNIARIAELDHAPRRESGTNLMKKFHARSFTGNKPQVMLTLGTRPHDAHLSYEHIPKLWQLVESVFP